MKRMETEKLGTFVLIGLLLLGAVGIASAQQMLPEGGDGFETAIEIQPGSYVTDHDIPDDAPEYFKLTVRAGQVLTVKVTNPTVGAADILSHTELYDEDRAVLVLGYDNPLGDMLGAGDSGRYDWLPSSETNSYTYYMSVGGGDIVATTQGTKYDISVEDNFDAGSQTDAGDTFETAMDITQGVYKGYLSGMWGTDIKDLYKLPVEKGTALTVKVTPPSNTMRGITLYNGDRVKIGEEYYPANPGAIVKTTQEITDSDNIYIAITSIVDDDYGEYTLEITTGAGAAAGEEPGETPSEEYPAGATEVPDDGGKAPGFEVVFVVAGLLAVAYLLRRRG
ncbi:MAG: PGF-CTERM sorting domain-containing protein [Halobacteriota archaeon]